MRKLKFEVEWKQFLMDLAQIGLGISVWWMMWTKPMTLWGPLAVVGAILAGFERSNGVYAKIFKVLELGAWSYALLISPSERGWKWFLAISVFNLLQLLAAGILGARDGGGYQEDFSSEESEGGRSFSLSSLFRRN